MLLLSKMPKTTATSGSSGGDKPMGRGTTLFRRRAAGLVHAVAGVRARIGAALMLVAVGGMVVFRRF